MWLTKKLADGILVAFETLYFAAERASLTRGISCVEHALFFTTGYIKCVKVLKEIVGPSVDNTNSSGW